MNIVSGLFDTYSNAVSAVHALAEAGFGGASVSLIANSPEDVGSARRGGGDMTAGAELGAALGGAGGLLAGIGVLALPGLGPVLAGGWLVAAALGAVAGAGVGAATGGLVGLLTGAGVPEADAHVYAEGLRRGGALVTVRVAEADVPAALEVLRAASGIDIEDLRRVYEAEGWRGFDDTAPPPDPEALRDGRPFVPPVI